MHQLGRSDHEISGGTVSDEAELVVRAAAVGVAGDALRAVPARDDALDDNHGWPHKVGREAKLRVFGEPGGEAGIRQLDAVVPNAGEAGGDDGDIFIRRHGRVQRQKNPAAPLRRGINAQLAPERFLDALGGNGQQRGLEPDPFFGGADGAAG